MTTTTSAASAARRATSAKHGSPSGQRAAPGHSSLVTLTACHAAARVPPTSARPGRRWASSRPTRPAGRPPPRTRAQVVELEGRLVVAPVASREALEADVVRAALQHRHERRSRCSGDEREVLAGQLVLEGLGGGGHHHRAARRAWRAPGRPGTCRCRAGLHHQVAPVLDGLRRPPRPSSAGPGRASPPPGSSATPLEEASTSCSARLPLPSRRRYPSGAPVGGARAAPPMGSALAVEPAGTRAVARRAVTSPA